MKRKADKRELRKDNSRLKAEKEKLIEQSKRLSTITQTETDAIITSDESTTIKSWNKGAEKIFGYTEAEVLGKSLEIIIPDDLKKLHGNGINRQNQGKHPKVIGKTVELRAVRKDGTEFPIELTLGKWTGEQKKYYSGIIRDKKKKKKAEAEVKRKNEILNETNIILSQQKQEIQTQAESLQLANNQISEQKENLEKKHEQITSSIQYAKRIQNAVMPSSEIRKKILPEHFILFKPRDVVSGDFYWMRKINQHIVIAVADCTGHGVPGAFMSMLGVALINELVVRKDVVRPDQLLNLLRHKIKKSLNQTGKFNEAKDGMDIAVCIIDTTSNILQYAGANNPLYIIRESNPEKANNDINATKISEHEGFTLFHIKADRQPIGIYLKETPFKNNTIELQKDDKLYMFSDGFVDQTGGDCDRKFMTKNFKKLLLDIHTKAFAEQKIILDETIENWKKGREQIDDIVVLGLKV